MKTASTKHGQPTAEAAQMLGLIEDMKGAPIRSATNASNYSDDGSPLGRRNKWTFIEKSPHAFGGRKPFQGGSMRRTASPDYANL